MTRQDRGLEFKVGAFVFVGLAMLAALVVQFGRVGEGPAGASASRARSRSASATRSPNAPNGEMTRIGTVERGRPNEASKCTREPIPSERRYPAAVSASSSSSYRATTASATLYRRESRPSISRMRT